jgi:hypothetical protein
MSLSENPCPITSEEMDSFAGWLKSNSVRLREKLDKRDTGSPIYAGVITQSDDWNALLSGEKLHIWSKKGCIINYDTATGELDYSEIDGDGFCEVVEAFKIRYSSVA